MTIYIAKQTRLSFSERGFRRIEDNEAIDRKSDLLWVHKSVQLRSGTCQDSQPSSSEQCYMFSNLKPK